jgi:predicted GNAT superfamily acetyltransferase
MFHGDTRVGTISSTSILSPKDFKEMTHILMAVDITKKVEEKQAWGIIAGRAIGGITLGNKRADERKIDQRYGHPTVTTLDIAICEDSDKTFLEPVG